MDDESVVSGRRQAAKAGSHAIRTGQALPPGGVHVLCPDARLLVEQGIVLAAEPLALGRGEHGRWRQRCRHRRVERRQLEGQAQRCLQRRLRDRLVVLPGC